MKRLVPGLPLLLVLAVTCVLSPARAADCDTAETEQIRAAWSRLGPVPPGRTVKAYVAANAATIETLRAGLTACSCIGALRQLDRLDAGDIEAMKVLGPNIRLCTGDAAEE